MTRPQFLALSLAAAALSGATAHGQTLSDNFDDGSINSAIWTVVEGLVDITETGGEVRVTAGVIGGYAEATMTTKATLSGDFDVQVDYRWVDVGFSANPSHRRRTQLHILDAATGDAYVLNFFYGGGGLSGGQLIFSSPTNSNVGSAADMPTDGRYRLVRMGGILTGYYWKGFWEPLGATAVFTGDALVRLNGNTNGGHPLDLAWDNFSATADTISNPSTVPSMSPVAAMALVASLLLGGAFTMRRLCP